MESAEWEDSESETANPVTTTGEITDEGARRVFARREATFWRGIERTCRGIGRRTNACSRGATRAQRAHNA